VRESRETLSRTISQGWVGSSRLASDLRKEAYCILSVLLVFTDSKRTEPTAYFTAVQVLVVVFSHASNKKHATVF